MADVAEYDIEMEKIGRPHLEFVLDESAKVVEALYIHHWFESPDKSGTFRKKEIMIGQYPKLAQLDQLQGGERDNFIHSHSFKTRFFRLCSCI